MDLRQKLESALQNSTGTDLKQELEKLLHDFPPGSNVYVLEKFTAYFDQSDDLFVVFESNQNISYLNPSASTMLGVHNAERNRKSLSEIIGEKSGRALDSYIAKAFDLGERVSSVHKMQTRHGERLFDSMFTPVRDEQGNVGSVVMVAREVRRRSPVTPVPGKGDQTPVSAEELESYTNDLRVLHDLLSASGHDFERVGAAYLSAGCRMFDADFGAISRIHGRNYETVVVAGDKAALHKDAHFVLEETYCSETLRFKHSVFTADAAKDEQFRGIHGHCGIAAQSYIGTPIWVNGSLFGTINFFSLSAAKNPFSEKDVEAIEIMASGISRTLALQIERKETDRFFKISPDMLGLLDLDGTVIRFNPAWTQMLGYEPEDLFEMPSLDLVHPNDRSEAREVFAKLLETSETVFTFNCRMQRTDGTYRWVEWNVASSEHENTVAVHLRDISQRRQIEDELRTAHADLNEARHELDKMASADALTGLANQRRFHNFYQQEWHRAVRYGTPLSIILLDLDDFARYNEIYGHPQGDEVLRQISLELTHGIYRPGDLVARLGSEEFGLVLSDTDEDGSRFVAEQLLSRMRGMAIAHSGSSTGEVLTVSVGVATAQPYTGIPRDELLKEAENALATAKDAGKNCMVGVVNTSIVLPPGMDVAEADPDEYEAAATNA